MTLLVILINLTPPQSHRREETYIAMVQLLNYCAMHTDEFIGYKKCAIIIAIHSDSSYLSNPKVRIQAGGHFFFKNRPDQGQHIINNEVVNMVSIIICNVMSSAYEAEIMSLYLNTKYVFIIWDTL